ncbi:uncharacterized protein LOC116655405 [Drosophila ananassae]|uniref:uncharacterized protein LOC116655405 n=1 Tax=Drosophila ananassae TaxID=7217 RepID=UPI0013A5D048|nr:uncharacterized protein LOC116655405 [Drosophila ananassae]
MNPAEAEKGAATPKKGSICTLCNKERTTGRARTKCGHVFHKACIATHAKSKLSCPTCKVACFEKAQAAGVRTGASTSQLTRRGDSPCGTSQASSQAESAGGTAVLCSIVSQLISAMQATLLEQLSERIDERFHQRAQSESQLSKPGWGKTASFGETQRQEDRSSHKGYGHNRSVAEVGSDLEWEEAQEFSGDEAGEVEAVALICWNCRKEGHRYHDCAGKRKVFCFGCGAPNVYKPSCPKCLKNGRANAPDRPTQRVPSGVNKDK